VDPKKKGQERDQIESEMRRRLHDDVAAAAVRVNDLSTPGRATPGGYPIAFALCDVADNGHEALSKLAELLVRRLNESPQLTDVGTSPSLSDAPQIFIDIDRRHAADLGVAMADIQKVLQIARGGFSIGLVEPGGLTLRLSVRNEGAFRDVEALKHLNVAGANGQRVPLSAVASVQVVSGPAAVERLDLYPMIEISANPAPGIGPAVARTVCEKIAAAEIAQGFRMIWLSHAP
jgi:multidrug efflux pump subunit AcrB